MSSSLADRAAARRAPVDSSVEEIAGIGRVFRSLTAKGRAHQKMLDKLDDHRIALVNKAIQALAHAVESAAHAQDAKNSEKKGVGKAFHAVKSAIKDRSTANESIKINWLGENWTLIVHNVIESLANRNDDADFNKDDAEGGSSWDRDEKPLLTFSGRFRKRIYVNVMRNSRKYNHQRDKGLHSEAGDLVRIGKHFHGESKKKKKNDAQETAGSAKQSEILEQEGLSENPLLAAAERLAGVKVTSTKQRYYKMIHKAISPSAWYKKNMEAVEKKVQAEHASAFTAAELASMQAAELHPSICVANTELPSVLLAASTLRDEACADEGEDAPWVLEIIQTGPAHELAMVAGARELVVIREVCSVVQGAYKMPVSAQGSTANQRVTMFLCEDELSSGELAMLKTILSSKTDAAIDVKFNKLA
jgi:hypothetical protein